MDESNAVEPAADTARPYESCGMPVESGRYCVHCVDEHGRLQDFDTRFARLVAWSERQGMPRDRAEESARDYMRTMPAWRDHPRLAAEPTSRAAVRVGPAGPSR